MQLYDEVIRDFSRLLDGYQECRVTRDVNPEDFAWESLEGQFLMKSDAAVELGGGNLPALCGVLYTVSPEAGTSGRQENRVTLYGSDLPSLKGDVPYARVTLAGIRREFLTEEYKLYNLFRSIEYIRYHVNPRGYMPRISTVQNREQIRVSADALEKGLDFYKVGRSYGEAYLRHPAVESAETVFITLDDFDYKALQRLLERAEGITMSLEHPLNNLKMDCNSCNLKPVCDEADALCGTVK